MKLPTTITGTITTLTGTDTRFGRRAEAVIAHTNQATGEVTEYPVKAWGDMAYALEEIGEGGTVGLSGKWKPKTQTDPETFLVKAASPLRIIDPATVDVSKYL